MVIRTIVTRPAVTPGPVPQSVLDAMARLATDVAAAHEAAVAAGDRASNAQDMVRRRDEKLNQASTDAATAVAEYESLAELAQSVLQAKQASEEDRAGLHDQADATAKRVETLEGRLARFAVGMRPVVALALGGTASLTIPLSRTMPTKDYDVAITHSTAAVGAAVFTDVAKTETTLTLTVKPKTGLTLTAGNVVVLAW